MDIVKIFVAPEIEVLRFTAADILTTSDEFPLAPLDAEDSLGLTKIE